MLNKMVSEQKCLEQTTLEAFLQCRKFPSRNVTSPSFRCIWRFSSHSSILYYQVTIEDFIKYVQRKIHELLITCSGENSMAVRLCFI